MKPWFVRFVIETKNYQGWIFGTIKQPQWTQQIYRHKRKFQNPLHQNLLTSIKPPTAPPPSASIWRNCGQGGSERGAKASWLTLALLLVLGVVRSHERITVEVNEVVRSIRDPDFRFP